MRLKKYQEAASPILFNHTGNMRSRFTPLQYCFYFMLCLLLFSACVNTSKAVYFNNIQDSEMPAGMADIEPLIQKNDLLSISVSSLNPEASKIFNAPNITEAEGPDLAGRAMSISGYLVNRDGHIQFPFLGSIQAAGLTKKQLKDNIARSLVTKKLLIDPIVNIRYLNFRVTVLGEVGKPTVVHVPSEKITLLEALGLAGDMTIYAKRDNLLLIREEAGKRRVTRLNLHSSDLFTSPYYYLQPNDIVIVEPDKARVATANPVRQWLPLIFSGLTVIVIGFDRLTR
jgi:polysaccharide biosynthesis/export protein